MIVPDSNLQRHGHARSAGTHSLLRIFWTTAFLLVAGWSIWLYTSIDRVARTDEARPADAIVVFGAAQYSGRPSPVLRARLDHALALYRRGLAPLVVALGGGSDAGTDKDNPRSEGTAGREYLMANGVPESSVIAETQSSDTEESVARLSRIARENHLRTMIVVSDGTHLFRIDELCARAGLRVFSSPRPELGRISSIDRAQRVLHEMLSYTAWRLHLH